MPHDRCGSDGAIFKIVAPPTGKVPQAFCQSQSLPKELIA